MNPPPMTDLDNIEQYLRDLAQFLVEQDNAPIESQGLLLARILPNMTAEHWQTLSRRHDLHDWHVVPLPHSANCEAKTRHPSIMVRVDEKKFLFSGFA